MSHVSGKPFNVLPQINTQGQSRSFDNIPLHIPDRFDSVPAAAYDSGWLLKVSSQTLGGRVVLAEVKVQGVTVTPGAKIKGVDMTRLFKATMKVNEDAVVVTPVRMSGAVSARNVQVGGTVQGWDLATAAILQNSSGVIFTAPKKFVDAFHVRGSLSAPDLHGAASSTLCQGNGMTRLFVEGMCYAPG